MAGHTLKRRLGRWAPGAFVLGLMGFDRLVIRQVERGGPLFDQVVNRGFSGWQL